MKSLVWLASDEFSRVGMKWRRGRWVPVVRPKDNALATIGEWCAITALACAIIDAGGWAGFRLSKPAFDAQSWSSAQSAINETQAGAGFRVEHCVGGARYAPFDLHTVVWRTTPVRCVAMAQNTWRRCRWSG
jgi:hypothetical protein